MRFTLSRFFLLGLLISLIALEIAPSSAAIALADGPCTTRGDNLTRNGSITDGGYDTSHGVVANSWNAFLIGGEWPAYDLADNESANGDIGGSSSQYIHGDGVNFDAGIYQSVAGVQAGASYEFSVGWSAMLRDTGGGHNQKIDDVVGRRVGADPFGGTDPNSPNLVWGPEVWSGGRGLNNPDMDITFRAMTDHVTVFVRVMNRGSAPSDKVFFDVICLVPRGDIPVEAVQPSATPTPVATETPQPVAAPAEPATPRPTRVPPTDTPLPPTETPIPPTPTNTVPPTRKPTSTPTPRRGIPQEIALAGNDSSGTAGSSETTGGGSSASSGTSFFSVAVIAGSVGIIGISLLGIVLVCAYAIWRIFARQVDDALDPSYPDDPFGGR